VEDRGQQHRDGGEQRVQTSGLHKFISNTYRGPFLCLLAGAQGCRIQSSGSRLR
jgi:hypothetical protein